MAKRRRAPGPVHPWGKTRVVPEKRAPKPATEIQIVTHGCGHEWSGDVVLERCPGCERRRLDEVRARQDDEAIAWARQQPVLEIRDHAGAIVSRLALPKPRRRR